MTLEAVLDRIEDRERTLTVYSPAAERALPDDSLRARGVAVEHEHLPGDGSGGFATLTEDGEFVGSVDVTALDRLADPPVRTLGEDADAALESLLDLLADTTFTSLDKRQLLATSREIEDRAFRRNQGVLRAGFQSLSALDAQREVYATLAAESGLDVHVYGRPDWSPDVPGVVVHAVESDEIGRFWFVIFDGGGNEDQACALLAEETPGDSGQFHGFWTYDPGIVRELDAHLRETYD